MPVKSIQQGTLLIKGLDTNSTKINAVNLANSELEYFGTATSNEHTGYYHAYAELEDATTIRVHRVEYSEQEYIHWKVTEYE